jgi:hypothetical protein
LGSDDIGQGLGFGTGKEEGQQVFVPGEDEDKKEGGDETGDGKGENDGRKDTVAGSAINGGTFF